MSVFESKLDFRVLSEEQIGEIHLATLSVIEKTGVVVQEEEALGLLKQAGADCRGTRVHIPRTLVEQALKTAPKSVTIYRRDGKPGVVLEGMKSYFGTGSDCPNIIDPWTGQRRRFTKADVENTARLCDALPNIDFFMSLGIAQDLPPRISDVHQFEAMIMNTEKPIVFTAHDRGGMEKIIRITECVVGEEQLRTAPSICLYAEPITPLQHIGIATKKMLLAAERRIPVVYTPCPMAGATTPATLAGTLVIANAEVLSGLVIHQLKQPGAPFIGGGVITIMDMGTSNFSYGAPEFDLMEAAYADISHHYGLPMFGTAGCSDSKVVDQQAAAESMASCLMMALSGANLIHDVGYLEYGLTGSLEMIVLTDEIVSMVRRIQRGIDVTPETLAVDVIDQVGPGANFLSHDHTLEHFRQESWFPRLFNRGSREKWEAEGSKTLGEKLNETVLRILREHEPAPVSEDIKQEVERIIRERKQEVRV